MARECIRISTNVDQTILVALPSEEVVKPAVESRTKRETAGQNTPIPHSLIGLPRGRSLSYALLFYHMYAGCMASPGPSDTTHRSLERRRMQLLDSFHLVAYLTYI
ncbi:hypothetical protein BDV95DRAFT_567745 [Massariosphaeria phaeospora]|uniref:Uncharacterized protein n=1 Tax=Massariosphaeria phaeospora TaxID=100035 RepID=A0A7C8MF21_9PLEO|nr:hypothetical protein BDV95DRAFT_567745 [Massariosphaeria phaeospora]